MKNLKKAASLILAVMMILSLAVPAFAAENQGTITITNAEGGESYTAYKIFDIVESGAGATVYEISSDSPWFGLVAAQVGTRYQSKIDGITITESSAEGMYTLTANVLAPGQEPTPGTTYLNATAFAEAANQYYKDNTAAIERDGEGTPFTGATVTVPYGYYYVTTQLGALVNVRSANTNVTDKGKNDLNFDKTIEGVAERQIGETVEYIITSKTPNTSNYSRFTYVIKDTLDAGLSLNTGSIKVMLGEDDITASTDVLTIDTTSVTNGFVLTFDMKAITANSTNVDKTVTVTYDATVLEAANKTIQWNNASLTYTDKGKDTTVTDKEYVYVCEVVIDKTDGGNTKLAGAQFVLQNAAGKYYHYAAGKVEWLDEYTEADIVTTDENGAANFIGLAAGSYALVEIEPPTGYNPLTEPQTFMIDGLDAEDIAAIEAGTIDTTTLAARLTSTQEVANYSGNLLPETGGIGTTIFYIAGAVLVIGASVLLITRRRMAK